MNSPSTLARCAIAACTLFAAGSAAAETALPDNDKVAEQNHRTEALAPLVHHFTPQASNQ